MKNCIRIENPSDCCACGACVNACPCGALTMKEDEAGFLYPAVNEALCVDCGKCRRVCVFGEKNVGANPEKLVYAAVADDREALAQSSSGGLFTALAEAVLAKGGAVFGAAFDGDLTLRHICAEKKEDLAPLRGSKYVQSDTKDTFARAAAMLRAGRTVFYTGTPCQIAGLKAFLGKEYDDLLTADLICHGVPSLKMLREDITYLGAKKKMDVESVRFRDKSYGWGVTGSLTDGKRKVKYGEGNSPYYFWFLSGQTYRESCYACRFPCEGRQGDLTLGDYWGVGEDLVKKLGADAGRGISCLLVNTEKGERWLSEIETKIALTPTDRREVEKRNKQLTAPAVRTPAGARLMAAYRQNGYGALLAAYQKQYKARAVIFVKSLIPKKIKRKLSKLLG